MHEGETKRERKRGGMKGEREEGEDGRERERDIRRNEGREARMAALDRDTWKTAWGRVSR